MSKRKQYGAATKMEARRRVKLIIKYHIKRAGHKVSDYEPKHILRAADEFLALHPAYFREAEKRLNKLRQA